MKTFCGSGGVDSDTLTPWKDKPEAIDDVSSPMRKVSGSEVSPRQISRFNSDPLPTQFSPQHVYMSDVLLVLWVMFDVVWGAAVVGITGYLVFWRGYSGWWFLLAMMLMSATGNPYKVIRKRFGLKEEE